MKDEKSFFTGDRVIVVDNHLLTPDTDLIGMTGTVLECDDEFMCIPVEFDDLIEGGHDAGGWGEWGYCYYIDKNRLDWLDNVQNNSLYTQKNNIKFTFDSLMEQ